MKKAISLIVYLVSIHTSFCQSFLMHHFPDESQNYIGLSYFRLIENDQNLKQSLQSGIYELNSRFSLGSKWFIGGSIPLIHSSGIQQFEPGILPQGRELSYSGTELGNIELNFDYLFGEFNESLLNLSVFIPVLTRENSEAYPYGYLVNIHEIAKFLPDILAIRINYLYEFRKVKNFHAGFQIGPQVWFSTLSGYGLNVEPEIVFNYVFKFNYTLNKIALTGEFSGITIYTEEGSFADVSMFQPALGIHLIDTKIRPGIFWSNVLEKGFFGSVLGIKLDYVF